MPARELATLAGLTHKQTIDALFILHRSGMVYRHGRKSTALWGSVRMEPDRYEGARDLQRVMFGFVRVGARSGES